MPDTRSPLRTLARWSLAGAMVFAGLTHLFWGRKEFEAQVPDWTTRGTGFDKDDVVIVSGVLEVMLGASLVVLPGSRRTLGNFLAAFFVAIFPGNVEQYLKKRDGFGLDTDRKRFLRLFFQPVLVAVALWSTRDGRR